MRFSDLMLGGVLLLFAAVLGGYSTTFPPIPGQRFGAGLFPLLIALGFAGCGAVLVVQGLRRLRRVGAGGEEPDPLVARTDWTHKPGAILSVFLTIALVIVYILASRHVGFMPMMAALMLVLFRLLRVPWGPAILFSVAGTLVLDFVFRSLLLVPLPFGIMPYPPW